MSLRLPRVDRILDHPALASSPALRAIQKRHVNDDVLAELRRRAQAGEISEAPEAEAIAREVARRLDEVMSPRPRALINATGVLLPPTSGARPCP